MSTETLTPARWFRKIVRWPSTLAPTKWHLIVAPFSVLRDDQALCNTWIRRDFSDCEVADDMPDANVCKRCLKRLKAARL